MEEVVSTKPLQPYISVIIPSYNRKKQLIQAVDSVLSQDYPHYDILVVDDGSTDRSAEEIQKYYSHSKVKFHRFSENRGVSTARNFGVQASIGEYIAFLDSDDLWHKNKLTQQMQSMQENPKYLISQTQEIWIRNHKRVNPKFKHQKIQGDLFEKSLELCAITPSSVILLREIWEQSGGFDENMKACEDFDLWLRLTAQYEIGLINELLLTRFGGHSDQLSQQYPVMDRFRIYSMLKILCEDFLTEKQREQTSKTLHSKWGVLKEGATKRGKDPTQFEAIINRVLQKEIEKEELALLGKKTFLQENHWQ